MTYGYSIKSWHEAGHLSREMNYFNRFTSKSDTNYIFITYGNKSDYEYSDKFKNSKIIPIYEHLNFSKYKLINLIKSFYIPIILKRLLVEEDIQIIKQNQLLGSWIPIGLKLLLKKPLIIRTGYDMYSFSKSAKNGLFKRLLYYFLTQITLIMADQYTVSSKNDFEKINSYLFKGKSTALMSNWVSEQPIYDLNKRDELKLLTVGRLEKQKNIEKIIRDFKNTAFEIDVIGEGSDKEFLEKLAEKNNVKVNFLGTIDNDKVLSFYKNYKYYLSSSIYEGNPKTVLEAMSSGCIILALKNPNIEEIIIHNHNGFLVKNDELSFLKMIDEIAKHENIEDISRNAISYVKKNNNLDDLVEAEYKSMIKLKK